MIYVGTAAWSIPKISADSFPSEGSHLERYAQVLNAVEINSSFYKDHLPKTYKRWADVTPANFKFSVKLNKRFTHECDLKIDTEDLIKNLDGVSALSGKWGVLLMQFAAGQKFDLSDMRKFYRTIRTIYQGPIALEARNMGWMKKEAIELMREFNISKVSADPEKCLVEVASELAYYRLHGSPEIYKSNYDENYLDDLYKNDLKKLSGDIWCIFDNTTFGYATNNAVTIMQKGESYERYQRIYDDRTITLHTINEH